MKLQAWKKRPFIYAFSLSIGFALLRDILRTAPTNYFFYTAAILYLILIFELFITRYYAKYLLDQYMLPPVSDTSHKVIQFIHHLSLPTLLYFSLVAFTYFNSATYLDPLIWLTVFIVYSVLFTNIRAFYEDKFKLEEHTHVIYDILNILLVYFLFEVILQGVNYFNLNLIYETPLSFIVIMSVGLLTVIRYKLVNRLMLLFLILIAIFCALLVLIGNLLNLATVTIALIGTLIFYYFTAFINHYREQTFSYEILFEYVVVFLLLIVLVIGIS